MELDEKSWHLTTFTYRGRGQFEWTIAPMCLKSFVHGVHGYISDIPHLTKKLQDIIGQHEAMFAPSLSIGCITKAVPC